MITQNISRKIVLISLLHSCLLSALAIDGKNVTLESLFPASKRNVKIERKALEQEKRKKLIDVGINPEIIDIYGEVVLPDSYGTKKYRWGDLPLGDRGPIPIIYDTAGMRKLPPLSKNGHPRMFFTNAERKNIRDRMETTEPGKKAKNLMIYVVNMLKGTYDSKADYAQPDVLNGRFHKHGYLPMHRMGDLSGNGYRNYSKGKAEGELDLGKLAFEAYRCWVYEDKENGRLAATAFITKLRDDEAKGKYGADFNTAYCYDFLFNWLTKEEQDYVRSRILFANYGNVQYGCFQNAVSTVSNWTSFSYRYFAWAPIDDNPYFDELQYRGHVRGMHNFLTYGWFKRGPCFEAMGKNTLGGEIAYVMTRRGDNLIAHPHLLANVREMLPHSIFPWGRAYYAYDQIGGVKLLNPCDILPIKYMFPEDKRIDWVYRNTVFDDYSFIYAGQKGNSGRIDPAGGDRLHLGGWRNNAFECLLFLPLSDFLPGNDNPEKLGLGDSFMGAQRGLMITRSDWGKDAAYMHHHCRGASGGHVMPDRNSFIFAALGQMWITNGVQGQRDAFSVVNIDQHPGDNSSVWKPQTQTPGKMFDYKREDMATFSCGDARYCFNTKIRHIDVPIEEASREDYQLDKVFINEGWQKNPYSFNDFTLDDDPAECYTKPLFLWPSWINPGKCGYLVQANPGLFVDKAFRSVGLVRGKYPYGLIVDDFATDDGKEHRYTWNAPLATNDIVVREIKEYSLSTNGKPVKKGGKGNRTITEITLANGSDHEVISVSYNNAETENLKLEPGWHEFELRVSGKANKRGKLGFAYDPSGGREWQDLMSGSTIFRCRQDDGSYQPGLWYGVVPQSTDGQKINNLAKNPKTKVVTAFDNMVTDDSDKTTRIYTGEFYTEDGNISFMTDVRANVQLRIGMEKPRGPELKLIVFDAKGRLDETTVPRIYNNGRSHFLQFSVWSRNPEYKVLLVPLRPEDPRPELGFDKSGNLVFKIGDQQDTIAFRETDYKRTGFKIDRDGGSSFHFGWDAAENTKVKPAPDDLRPEYKKKKAAEDAIEQARINELLKSFDPAKLAGLSAYYSFDTLSGGIVKCKISPNNNFKLVGARTCPGVCGAALNLNGNVGRVPAEAWNSGKPFALSFWVKDPDHKGEFFDCADNNKERFGFILQTLNNKPQYHCLGKPLSGNFNRNIKEWTHVVFTGDGRKYEIYINGKRIVRGEQGRPLRGDLKIGSKDFNGMLDELRIFNRELNALDAEQLYEWDRQQMKKQVGK